MIGVQPVTPVDDASAPWVARVEHAEARLEIPGWPRGASAGVLRGAVCAELERVAAGGVTDQWEHLHVDWHNHLSAEDTRHVAPRVMYRVHRGPSLWVWGLRAGEHAARLVRDLRSLRLPRGGVVRVAGIDVVSGYTDVRVRREAWHRYDLVSPLFPPRVSHARRPRSRDGREAWAGQLLESCVLGWMREAGWADGGSLSLHVHVEGYQDHRIRWRHGSPVNGFRCRFLANVALPDGVGLGSHRAEGFGEVRHADPDQ